MALKRTRRHRAFGLALVLSVSTALRKANILERDQKLTDGRFHGLRWENLTSLTAVSATFRIIWTKTTFQVETFLLSALEPGPFQNLCPVKALLQARSRALTDFVCEYDGRAYSPSEFAADYRRLVGESLTAADRERLERNGGIRSLTPHGLRRVMASYAHETGFAKEVIMKALHHKTETATDLYLTPMGGRASPSTPNRAPPDGGRESLAQQEPYRGPRRTGRGPSD